MVCVHPTCGVLIRIMSTKGKVDLRESKCEFFVGCQVYILPVALGPKRLGILATQMLKNGAKILTSNSPQVTHVIVEDSVLKDSKKCVVHLKKIGLSLEDENIKVKIVGTSWVTKCLKEKQCCDTNDFEFDYKMMLSCNSSSRESSEIHVEDGTNKSKRAHDDSEVQNLEALQHKKAKSETEEKSFCSRASSTSSTASVNQAITDELQKLSDAFRSSGDHWRAFGYDKAISSIKAYGKEITSYEEAESLPGVGKKMAAKVGEILESGSLRKVEEICGQERMRVAELFVKVWGVGPTTADAWYQQGFRTLEDLKNKANLTKQQMIGLKHFEDIDSRMPREETKEIGDLVINVAHALDPELSCMLCGSYRRGKATCGDIDVLIAKDSNRSQFLSQVVDRLRTIGLLTDDLVSMESSGAQKKYMGVCKLPGEDRKHRRLDIFVAPQAEFATALMHYTGSALFNRSIRQLAINKGMSLSEHSLVAGIVKKGKAVIDSGHVVPTPTEESIFTALGLDYRPPEERDH